jgi:hypothetical protein
MADESWSQGMSPPGWPVGLTSHPAAIAEAAATAPATPAPPAISLPTGGGAIRGIGEKFAADPASGAGSMIVPIAASPGRFGFGPQLALAYNSGAGNGPFGFGWSLVDAENYVRAGHAAWWYSCRMPPSRSRRRTTRFVISPGSVIGSGNPCSGREFEMPWWGRCRL